jgi:RNA methyltransferase, TrmH family
MKIITSATNEKIKLLVKLSTTKGRTFYNQFIAEGIKVCSTLHDASIKIVQIYCTEARVEQALLFASEDMITIITEPLFQKISNVATPSGLFGVFTIPPKPSHLLLQEGLVLLSIADPGNMGTLIRTTAAMNKKTLVIIEGVDPWSPKVVQSTMGMIGFLDIFQLTWLELMKYKKELRLCALVVKDGQKPQEISFTNSLLIVGNESQGIPENILKQCDSLMTLEMPGKTESLNAAVAGSIALYLAWHKQ